ncbi:MAG: 3-oxoacid CoA-transferase subunit A [Bacilli bacterium]|jgi:acetate CoA/acetoacetate CoA-transferase alpha subunit|nr:3-oxoacid CoA-transferase subunit A [Bacilli bacterium]
MIKIVEVDKFKEVLFDGMSIMVGGFMTVGTSKLLIDAIVESGVKDLTLYCNDAGYENEGIGRLIASGQCKKLIASHIGLNPQAQQLMNENMMEVILVPQGTLVEQIRAGGSGLGGVLTPTGLGTLVEEGKDIINVDGKDYLLEKPLSADLTILEAYEADSFGNAKLIGTTKNFSPLMALAAKKVAIEVENLRSVIDPNDVSIPGVLVDYVIREDVVNGR